MPRFALVSVSVKGGLEPFVRGLHALGFAFLSTGGTARALREWGLPVQEVRDWTGFPESLDGRVKTLHPRIHAALLANLHLPDHQQTLRELNLTPIALVVVNLYPFERALRAGASEAEQRAEQERLQREQERQRAEAERLLREQEQRRAEAERQRAEQERLLREQAEQRLAELEAELKRLRGEQ